MVETEIEIETPAEFGPASHKKNTVKRVSKAHDGCFVQ